MTTKQKESLHAHPDYLVTRVKVFDELSYAQPMFCVCGRLATGLHERACRKFNNKVDNVTYRRLFQ